MAVVWQDQVIPIVRVLLNDLESPHTFSDRRLEQLCAVAAHLVTSELYTNFVYSVNIAARQISPDPYTSEDSAFINLMSLKAACIADISTYRQEAMKAGIKARLGPAILETVERLPGFQTLLDKGPCALYEEMKMQISFGNASICRIILSPFVSNDFDPEDLAGGGDYGRSTRDHGSSTSRMFD